MWSTNFLIGVFAALYASVASASPIVTPDTTALLVPRGPDDYTMCVQMMWLRRECAPNRSAKAWNDVCQSRHFPLNVLGPGCPGNTYCENVVVNNGPLITTTIRCVAASAPGVSQPRMKQADPQVGSSPKKQATSSGPSQVYHQIIVADDMLASVSAFFLSEDESHVMDVQNIIVGKIRGKEITVCKGEPSDDAKRRECYPTGRQQLWLGDIIDLSWGLNSQEAGSLKYTIWPS